MPSFLLTSSHLAETSLTAFYGLIPLSVQLSKNITKWLLLVIIHVFSTHLEINLFHLHNLKTWTSYETTTTPCIWRNEIKEKKKQNQYCVKYSWIWVIKVFILRWNTDKYGDIQCTRECRSISTHVFVSVWTKSRIILIQYIWENVVSYSKFWP